MTRTLRRVDERALAAQARVMRSRLLVVLVSLLVLVGLALVGGLLFISPEWEVSRSRVLAAPTTRVHAAVANLEGWPDWTGWGREVDPEATWSFEGAPAGEGAMMRWSGPRFGQGRLVLTRADPAAGVDYEMVLESNDDTTVLGSIRYQPVAAGTQVTWRDRGRLDNNPFGRLMKPAFERSVGEAFERGLSGLAERVERRGR